MAKMRAVSRRIAATECCWICDGFNQTFPFLFPTSFITAMDYFDARYPDRNVEFMMAALYTYPATLCTFLSTLLVARFSLNARIRSGYFCFLPSLILIPLLDLLLQNNLVRENVGYGLTLAVIVLVGIGCGGQYHRPLLLPSSNDLTPPSSLHSAASQSVRACWNVSHGAYTSLDDGGRWGGGFLVFPLLLA